MNDLFAGVTFAGAMTSVLSGLAYGVFLRKGWGTLEPKVSAYRALALISFLMLPQILRLTLEQTASPARNFGIYLMYTSFFVPSIAVSLVACRWYSTRKVTRKGPDG